MDSKKEAPLSNANVRELYDSLLKSFDGSYTDQRWHSSPLDEFEYRQTARALGKALGKRRYGRILEIGPGDGAWTPFLSRCADSLHLVDQSGEMLRRVKQRMAGFPGITCEQSDFIDSKPPSDNDLIVAVRCFEYFDDKSAALRRMRDLLAPNGRIIIVTKNAELFVRRPTEHPMHRGKVSRRQMERLVRDAGLAFDELYPAVLRLKRSSRVARFVFDAAHRVVVGTRGAIPVPLLIRYASESYLFKLRRASAIAED
jgi:SAM-dependent methyltransferase